MSKLKSNKNSEVVSKGMKMIKISDTPPTWIEVPANATEEQIQERVKRYKNRNLSLEQMARRGDFDSLKNAARYSPKSSTYSGPIYHIPRINETF